MKTSDLIAAVLVIAGSAVCVRLGFWQLSRMEEKRALNESFARSLEAPPIDATRDLPPLAALHGRRVRVRGRFDERHQILLRGREEGGLPGVQVVTPLLPEDGSAAVLVNRGWLPADDAATARPQDFPEPGEHEVVGVVEPLEEGAQGPALRLLSRDGVTLWSAARLDRDSLAARLPYALARFGVLQLPGAAVPPLPRRRAPQPLDDGLHLGYAVQWFAFATILLGGSAGVLWSRRRRSATR